MTEFNKLGSFREFNDDGSVRASDPDLLAKAKADTLATRRAALIGNATEGHTRSYIGGRPLFPEQLDWPTCDERPLAFICQIDLAELPQSDQFAWLPSSGVIFYFVGQVGFDGIDYSHRVFRVIYSRLISDRERECPTAGAEPYGQENLVFEIKDTYKSCTDQIEWQDLNAFSEWEFDINPARQWSTRWQLGGWVSDLQGEENMPAICEGRYRAIDLGTAHRLFASSFPEWQFIGCVKREVLDGPQAEYMQGYFWIKDSEALRGDFSRAALLVQSV